jgi:WD40 repeat protein
MWSLADGSSTVMAGHDDDVYRARLSFDERQVATASLDGSVRVWKRDLGSSRTFTEGSNIYSLKLDGNLALVFSETAVSRWNLITGERESLFAWGDEAHSLGKGMPSSDGKRLAVPLADYSIEVRSLMAPPVALRGHTALVEAAAWGPDNSFYSGSADGSVRRWDLATGQSRVIWDGSLPVTALAVSPDGHVFGSTTEHAFAIEPDGTMHPFASGKRGCFMWASFERLAGKMLVQRCDMTAALVDEHGLATELDTGGYRIIRYDLSANGQQLAAATADRVIRVWSMATGRLINTLRGHSDLVMSVAFSPDGRQLASASYDKTIRVWDLTSSRHRVLRGHSAAVSTVQWRGTNQLVSGSSDGTIRLWDVPALDLPEPGAVANELTTATSAKIDETDRPTSHGS